MVLDRRTKFLLAAIAVPTATVAVIVSMPGTEVARPSVPRSAPAPRPVERRTPCSGGYARQLEAEARRRVQPGADAEWRRLASAIGPTGIVRLRVHVRYPPPGGILGVSAEGRINPETCELEDVSVLW